MFKELLRDKSAAHLLMIGAVLLLFVSQFFYYFDEPHKGRLVPGGVAEDTVVIIDPLSRGQRTGWDLHPHAYVILVVLAFALLRDDIYSARWFKLLGYWVCVALMVTTLAPGAPATASGAMMGVIAVGLAALAAVLNLFTRKPTAPVVGA